MMSTIALVRLFLYLLGRWDNWLISCRPSLVGLFRDLSDMFDDRQASHKPAFWFVCF